MLNVQKYTKNLKSETAEQNRSYEEQILKLKEGMIEMKRKYKDQIEVLSHEKNS